MTPEHDALTNVLYGDFYQSLQLNKDSCVSHGEVVRFLTKYGAEINAKYKPSFLRSVIRYGHVKLVEKLVESCDVNHVDYNGTSLLHLAAEMHGITSILLEQKADLHLTDDKGFTPCAIAAINGWLPTELMPLNCLEVISVGGFSDLAWSITATYYPNVARDLKDILHRRKKLGWTPQRCNECTTTSALVVQQNAAATVDILGRGPLHRAARSENLQLIKQLIDSGTDINATDFEGNSSLHEAPCTGNLKVMQLLIDSGANVNAQNHSGNTPLHLTMLYNNCLNTISLLNNGADCNLTNAWMNTPLLYATWRA